MAIVDRPGVDGSEHIAPEQIFGGRVDDVLKSPRIAPAPATLEEARNAPGRAEKIEELTRLIEAEGIKYVFFQQVSITGRVMGKGVVASFFPQVAEKGYQLVYGATANLFTDRARQLHRLRPRGVRARGGRRPRHVRGPAVGQPRRARVLRLLRHRDRRAARRRPAPEPQAHRARVRAGARLPVPHRHRARDDVAQAARGRLSRPRASPSPTATTSTSSRSSVRCCSTWSSTARRSGLDMSYGDHEDAPGQLELNFRFDRPVRTADNITTYRQVCAAVGPQARPAGVLHAQAVHRRVGQRPPPPLHADGRERQQRLPRPRRPGPALGDRPPLPRRHARALPGADVRRQPDGELLLPHVGHRLLGPDLQELGLAEPHDDGPRRLRRALRVPRRRLVLQPVPDVATLLQRRPRRRPPQARPGPAAAGQHVRPARRRAPRSRRCPTASAPRSRRSPPTRSSAARCRAASTRSSTTTSATSGSATWRR